MANSPIDALLAGVKQFLAELDDADFQALTDEVRAPADDSADSGDSRSEDAKFAGRLFSNK